LDIRKALPVYFQRILASAADEILKNVLETLPQL
jgi:hypothetical protein